ncbi:hypothetical protein AB0P21_00210 [Kribbella sp. NPDC056861]|uniref:hypothetical protein n=1 Tax=Kribbella sp. NPDC056861 TaxID=3154857 RepID=UPI003426F1A1
MTGADAGAAADGRGEEFETGMRVLLPDGVPVVYPQAARVLCRIVVRLAKMEQSATDADGTEETSS